MPSEISPRKMQEAAMLGRRRMEIFLKHRVEFIKSYTGPYYGKEQGMIGEEPINLIFNAVRVLVPNLVMTFPRHTVTSKFAASRGYAELLGLALDQQAKELRLKDVYRRWIIDAIFLMGVLKTGLAESGSAIAFNEYDEIDPGQVYTENVSIANMVFDPRCLQNFREGAFMGDAVRIPRANLLDSGLYDNAMVERLPSARSGTQRREQAEALSNDNVTPEQLDDFADEVDIVELWVPEANAIVTIPGHPNCVYDEYLRVADYYGPDTGPYTLLNFTPAVPDNPVPLSFVSMLQDLHIMANRMAAKTINQADRQKDVIGYTPTAADDAEALRDAKDGEAVAMQDPSAVRTFSFGGQQQSNEAMTGMLMMWHNMMAANPQGIGGQALDADSATEAKILQGNASIGLEDMKDMVYAGVAEEAGKRAWFIHTDPLVTIPLSKRQLQPARYAADPVTNTIQMVQPAQVEEVQVFLTPEARSGDYLDFTFDIEPESLTRMNSEQRLQKAMEFAVKVLPAASAAALTCAQMGVPFSFARFATRMAKIMGLEWMDEVFHDPEFQMQMQMIQQMGPQPGNTQGMLQPLMQNGQPGNVASVGREDNPNRQAQMGAAEGQADLPVRPTY